MDKLKKLPVKKLLILLLAGDILFLCLNLSYAYTPYVSGSNFDILINENSALGFQNDPDESVTLTPTTGDLNTSINSLLVYGGGGEFRFLSNERFTLTITYTVTNLRIAGDKGNGRRPISSGDSVDIDSADTVIITWIRTIEPWLPIMFIFGIFGMISTIGGAMYAVNKIKKKEYEKGIVNGIIFISVGFCLVLAWLWGG